MPRRQAPAERLTLLDHVPQLRARVRRPVEERPGRLLVGERDPEPVADREPRLLVHRLLLVGDVAALAGLPHAVALDRLGEDHRGLPRVTNGGVVGGVDLLRVVAAAPQRPDLVVGPVGDHRRRLRIPAEEVLADVRAVVRLEGLVLAVDALVHQIAQDTLVVRLEQRVPVRAPDHLDHVPARAAEVRLELLDDLPVATHRAVEALEVAVDDEDEVVELLASGERDRAHRLGLVHLAVAHERPDLAVALLDDPAGGEVLHEARLVDRHQGAEPHRDGGELPEAGHQPRVRVGREPAATHLLPEAAQLVLRQPALEERARVEPRGRMALEVHQVAEMVLGTGAPEVVEPDLVQRLRGLVARDVAPELGRLRVRLQDDRDRVPAHERGRGRLQLRVAGHLRLVLGRDRVDVRGLKAGARVDTEVLRMVDDPVEQVRHPVAAVDLDDRLDGVEPLAGLDGLDIGGVRAHAPSVPATPSVWLTKLRVALWQRVRAAPGPLDARRPARRPAGRQSPAENRAPTGRWRIIPACRR